MRVLCVYDPQPKFDMGEEYVYRLQENVANWLPVPHQFICLTRGDIPGVMCEPLTEKWDSYYCKLEVFRHCADLNLYLDLDTIPTNDLRPIVELAIKHPGTMFGAKDRMGEDALNSSVLCWTGDLSYLSEAFAAEWAVSPKRIKTRYMQSLARLGDQGFIQDHLRCPYVYLGNLVASYKLDPVPVKQEAAVVFFHGRPRPHQVGWQPW